MTSLWSNYAFGTSLVLQRVVDVVCVTYIELRVLRSCNGITVAVSVQIMRFELVLCYRECFL